MSPFVNFMRSGLGRGIRILLGVVLMYWGFFGDGGAIVGIIGIAPLAAGIFNFCLFAPLFGLNIWGQPRSAH